MVFLCHQQKGVESEESDLVSYFLWVYLFHYFKHKVLYNIQYFWTQLFRKLKIQVLQYENSKLFRIRLSICTVIYSSKDDSACIKFFFNSSIYMTQHFYSSLQLSNGQQQRLGLLLGARHHRQLVKERSPVDTSPAVLPKKLCHPWQTLLHFLPRHVARQLTGKPDSFPLKSGTTAVFWKHEKYKSEQWNRTPWRRL